MFHSTQHRLHDAKREIHAGEFVDAFERPSRMDIIIEELAKRGYDNLETPDAYGLDMAARVHRADYLDFMARLYDEWQAESKAPEANTYIWPAATMRRDIIPRNLEARMGYYSLSTDTAITEGTWAAALASKDCAQAGVDAIINGALSAFALARPPGHHAASFQYGGYCFLNNAAIAAEHFLQNGAQRISILDVDYHHGNGTQEIFYARNDVQFLSIHGDPYDSFPYFLGYEDEKGAGAGAGFNHNYPLPNGTGYVEWKKALLSAIGKINAYRPDALIVSLGLDTFEADPISGFKLKSQNYFDLGATLAAIGLPTLFVMEGGYAINDLGVNTANVIEGFDRPN